MIRDEFFETALIKTDFGNLFSNRYKNFSFPKHFHESLLIQVIEEGQNEFYCNGKKYRVGPDDLVFINPGEVHTGYTDRNQILSYKVFYPDLEDWLRIHGKALNFKSKYSDTRLSRTIVKDQSLISSIKCLYVLCQKGADDLLIKEVYHHVMSEIVEKYLIVNTNPDENVSHYAAVFKRVDEFIRSNLDTKLTVDIISKEAFLSQFHFLRIFKSFTGITLHQYVLSLRIEKSKTLLHKAGVKVGDIYYDLGFQDHTHFTKVFKRMTGLRPKHYKSAWKQ
jgi:AraC-like DNA-binding protein